MLGYLVACRWLCCIEAYNKQPPIMIDLSSENNSEAGRVIISGREAEEFTLKGHRVFVIPSPSNQTAIAQPWVLYAPTLPGLPSMEEQVMFQKFLDAGIAIAGIDVGESYGSPPGRALFSALYAELVQGRGFAKKPALLARSRGGLMLYNLAVEHPECVGCVAGIYPVCNLKSYPGLAKACGAYNLSETELAANLAQHNPVDRIAPLARAGVPIMHLHGDNDEVVPMEENSAALAEAYRKHGGQMKLMVVPGQGHNRLPVWFQSPELIEFVITHAKT